ncbi:hypothetical protein LOAG_03689 [Loa loa]|uniref:Uncharacterized protein n=1 Tax=Loa loa TaxID=7209 RepID=A0A1S0U449_LOALO|nr:hypothetical protein LOAG_03689 [Loa loa]EFO24800.1 hypothetical protein LOAG_03689 [Loa loa]
MFASTDLVCFSAGMLISISLLPFPLCYSYCSIVILQLQRISIPDMFITYGYDGVQQTKRIEGKDARCYLICCGMDNAAHWDPLNPWNSREEAINGSISRDSIRG